MCERIFRGNIVFSTEFGKLEIIEGGYIVVADNKIVGVYSELPSIYKGARVFDFGKNLIIPGIAALDLEVPDSLYAEDSFIAISRKLRSSGVTRSIVEGTSSVNSSILLMNTIAEAGLGAYISSCISASGESSLLKLKSRAEEFMIMTSHKYENVKPMISASLADGGTAELMDTIIGLSRKHGAKLKIEMPNSQTEVSLDFPTETIFTSSEAELELERLGKSSFVSISEHSGLSPLEVEAGMKKGVSFGLSSSVLCANKVTSALLDQGFKLEEVLYLATKGGGAFFGKTGSFEEGYEFDAVVIESDKHGGNSILEVLRNFFTSEQAVVDMYVAGQKSLGN